MENKNDSRSVGIIGTGNYARALAKRLFYSGYDVTLGSRKPELSQLSSIDECFCNITITTIESCIKTNQILFIAIYAENYKATLENYEGILSEKLLIDVSNRNTRCKGQSNAEYLKSIVPSANVVKAFNVVSAYTMEYDYNTSSKRVFIAGDKACDRETVASIAREIGFLSVDFGYLRSAQRIEDFTLRLFPEWRAPLGFTLGVFNLWLLYVIYIYFIEKTAYRWDQIFVKVLNKPLCMTGITTLSVTYLASSVAAFFQIYHGTKHISFPKWLDKWLRSRKQLGIVSFTLIFVHTLMSILIMSPTYLSSWYQSTQITIPDNFTQPLDLPMKTWMIWKGEAACLMGILSFLVLCFIAISTLPTVADALNWREWRFVQSKLGHLALFLGALHVIIMGAPGWVKTPNQVFKSITFLSSLIPWLTLLLKFMLSFPCLDRYVNKIRRGWERHPRECKGKCTRVRINGKGYTPINFRPNKESCKCAGDNITMETILEEPSCPCANHETV
ncbi:hypothetical protein CHS0354_010406 [Potamilus streckersoni]|uniref:Pyrroline-5-carboxylate reductase catalytic N-terminal domain-containing protein n=1 Tax=Potamilus streckersoni TaxID=2493646 RepID=A0AAE0T598_9BIVA|nr:hypothetical protein CHS0354_010406 [Potamilus streckersoni]